MQPVIKAEDLAALREILGTIVIRDELVAYLVDIVRATRSHESVLVGAGPRATQSLHHGVARQRRDFRARLRDAR